MENINIACLQMNSTSLFDENIKKINYFCGVAKKQNIQFLATPENCFCMPLDLKNIKKENEILEICTKIARDSNLWLNIGSAVIRTDEGHVYNRSYLISNAGNLISYYDKVHLFDVQLASGDLYRESDFFSAGNRAVIAKTPFANIGLTICYDLRFPYLYRLLAQNNAEVILVSSAFTKFTGNAHWEVLLRARAIENSCYIIAPNQCGVHADQKETFGHSMIISPWGEIITKIDEGEGIISTPLDLSQIHSLRKTLTSLKNREVHF